MGKTLAQMLELLPADEREEIKARTRELLESDQNSETNLEKLAFELYASIGQALTAWSGVEWQLSRLFSQSISPKGFDPTLSSSVAERAFWSVHSFEAKLKMTNATIKESFYWAEDDLLKKWTNLKNRLSKSNSCRNKIAHGSVVQHNQGQGDGSIVKSVYFSPYYWDRDAKMGRKFIPANEPPVEKLTVKDILKASVRFVVLKEDIHALSLLIHEKMKQIEDS